MGTSNPKSRSYLIIGCGHFGSRAAGKLLWKDPLSKIIIVDENNKAFEKVSQLPVQTEACDGLFYLKEFLSRGLKADYIIPAVPVHLAFEFLLSKLKPLGVKKGKLPSLPGLPNPVRGKNGDLCTSLADFLCSEECPEPAQYCTHTKKRRSKPLYKILNDLIGAFESKVIRSQQLGPGIGGYRPEALLGVLEDIKKEMNSVPLILITTASRCHGVTSALSFQK
jgi:hypothetical protein